MTTYADLRSLALDASARADERALHAILPRVRELDAEELQAVATKQTGRRPRSKAAAVRAAEDALLGLYELTVGGPG